MPQPTRPRPGVFALRARPVVDIELEWFFNRADCDMGLRSTYVLTLSRHRTYDLELSAEDAAEAAHAHRQIRGWLLAVGDSAAGVLQCAYETRGWPAPLFDELGRLTGVVVRLACALDPWPPQRDQQQAIEHARAEWLSARCKACRGFSFGPLVRLRREAERRFVLASHAYAVVRGDRPCVVRAS